jgi:hypothetical protein
MPSSCLALKAKLRNLNTWAVPPKPFAPHEALGDLDNQPLTRGSPPRR